MNASPLKLGLSDLARFIPDQIDSDTSLHRRPGISDLTETEEDTMIEGIQLYLVAATALGSALVGGVFYAFSAFVMAGLKRLPAADGMAAMQSINVTAVQPGLMIPFFGTMIASIAVAITAIADWNSTTSFWLLAGAASYVLGAFAMTAAYHVPRNNALAATRTEASNAGQVWARYLDEWTRGNHVRTLAALAAAALLGIAIRLG